MMRIMFLLKVLVPIYTFISRPTFFSNIEFLVCFCFVCLFLFLFCFCFFVFLGGGGIRSWVIFRRLYVWSGPGKWHVQNMYTMSTLKYGVNLLNASVSYVLRLRAQFWLQLAACKRVFSLRYSDTRSTFTNYLLLRYKSTGSWCYGM